MSMYGTDAGGNLYFFQQAASTTFYKATLSNGTYSAAFQVACCGSNTFVWSEAVSSDGTVYATTGSNPSSTTTSNITGPDNFRIPASAPANFGVAAISLDNTVVYGYAGGTLWAVKNGQATSLGVLPNPLANSAGGPNGSLYLLTGNSTSAQLTIETPSGSGYVQSSFPVNRGITANAMAVNSGGDVFVISGNYLVELIPSGNQYVSYLVGNLPANSSTKNIGTDSNNNVYVSINIPGQQSDINEIYEFSPLPPLRSSLATDFNSLAPTQEVEYLGADQHVHALFSSGGTWAHSDITATANAPLAAPGSALSSGPNSIANSQEVEYLGVDQHVHALFYNGSTWQPADLTSFAGAPLAAPGTSIAANFNSIANTKEVEYLGNDQHVYQLWYSGTWQIRDLTALAGAPLAAPRSALTDTFNSTVNTQEVKYIGTDQHVYAFFYNGLTWQIADLTSFTGAPLAAPGSALAANFNPVGNVQEAVYLGSDQHVHQLWYNGNWNTNDLTVSAGAPLALPGSALSDEFNPISNTQHVTYLDIDQHVHVLYFTGTWQHVDVSAQSGAPVALPGTPLVSTFDRLSNAMEIEYLGTDQHVHQLFYTGTVWTTNDLTSQTGAPPAQ